MTEEAIRTLDDFLNENSLWSRFEEFIKEKGLKLEDFGLEEDD